MNLYQKFLKLLGILRECSIIFVCVMLGIALFKFIPLEISGQKAVNQSQEVLKQVAIMTAEVRKNTADQETFVTQQLPVLNSKLQANLDNINKLTIALTRSADAITTTANNVNQNFNNLTNSTTASLDGIPDVLKSLNTSIQNLQPLEGQLTDAAKNVNALVSDPSTKQLPENANRLVSNAADTTKTVNDGLKAWFHPATWQKACDGIRTAASVVSAAATTAGVAVLSFIKKIF